MTPDDYVKTILLDCCECNHTTRICFQLVCTTITNIALDMIYRGEY